MYSFIVCGQTVLAESVPVPDMRETADMRGYSNRPTCLLSFNLTKLPSFNILSFGGYQI